MSDPLAPYFDERTGLPLVSTLPIVLADQNTMASLGGRVSVLALEIGAAVELHDDGDDDAALAVLATVLHRLHSDALLYSGTGAFSPMIFLDEPGTLVVVRRDVLGDESSYWLAERTLRELNTPDRCRRSSYRTERHRRRRHRIERRGGRPGPEGPDRPQRGPFRRTRHRGGPHDRPDRDGPGRRCGARRRFDRCRARPLVRHARRRRLPGRHLRAVRGPRHDPHPGDRGHPRHRERPFIEVSATALANPRAVSELISRVAAAGLRGRVGLVLPADFPTAVRHRAVQAVSDLHAAGFYVVADRTEPWSRLRSLPECPVDGVVVGTDLALGAPTSAADRALLEAIVERQGVLRVLPSRRGTRDDAGILGRRGRHPVREPRSDPVWPTQ